MNRSLDIEVKVGVFVSLGLALIMLTILMLGGGQTLLQKSLVYHSRFPQIEGLVEGATVKMSGVKIGQVTKINLTENSGVVDVQFAVNSKFGHAIHQDSTVGIQTQGVLGDRYLIISPGTTGTPLAETGIELKSETPRDLKDYLNSADAVLDRLKNSLAHMDGILESFHRENRSEIFFRNITAFSTHANDTSKGMRESMDHFRSVLSKVDNGQGTIGALINDPSLYDDIKALVGGANRNRVLKYFIRKSVESSQKEAKNDSKKK